MPTDPLSLAQSLIRCPSITPVDAGALAVLEATLSELGFVCHRLRFSDTGTADVENLYARFGRSAPNFCFAGHTDVVPIGDKASWGHDPFGAEIDGDYLVGRGASDMKGAIAAFVAAAADFIDARQGRFQGSISLLITGDEEGPAVNGTVKVLRWMQEHGETIDACIVGEPTNPIKLGEMAKIGRRGSLTGRLTVLGSQGHVAYPHLADNPIPRLIKGLALLQALELDTGSDAFQPSNLEVTTVDVGNPASNVIPAAARAVFNVRYNDHHSGKALEARLRELLAEACGRHELLIEHGASPFLTPQGKLSEDLSEAVFSVLGIRPELSTTGGTSDARFIKDYCPVIEFGLTGQTMHKVDERVALRDLWNLRDIYQALLQRWFA